MDAKRLSRREFLGVSAAAMAAMSLSPSLLAEEDEKPALEKRVLGRTGLKVTTVSLGCMVSVVPVMQKALDMGINWFDTAHTYKGGRNEGELAKALGNRRKDVYISTKIPKGGTDAMLAKMDTSLQRLKTDHVEMALVHGVSNPKHLTNENYINAMVKAKEAGKTRFIGVSTHGNMAACINAAVKAKVWDAVLTKYNYTTQSEDLKKAIANAKAANVGIIAMKTQLGNFPNPDGGLTPHQAALKWVLSNTNVTCAIPGMHNFNQLEQNFAVMGKRLSLLDRRRLKLYAEATAALHCAGCGACSGLCPKGVDVAEVRRCAMYLDGYGDPDLAHENYHELAADAAPCLTCDRCEVSCVANVALQPILSNAHRRLA